MTSEAASPIRRIRIFRVIVGDNVAEYVRKRRLQRAALQLRSAGLPITEIALESGYETASAFTRAFNALYGIAPSAFRADDEQSAHTGGSMDVQIEQMGEMRLLGMRHIGPYSEVKHMWPTFMEHVFARGLKTPESFAVGLSYDDPDTVDQSTLRYDACITSDAPGDDVLMPIVIEAGRWCVYRHVGNYELIGHYFDRLMDYIVLHLKHELRHAPCMEIYRNDPSMVAPDECITDLAVPIV